MAPVMPEVRAWVRVSEGGCALVVVTAVGDLRPCQE